MPDSDRLTKGMATRRATLGDAYVDAAMDQATEFDAPLQDLITASAWGHVWSRDTWPKRDRSIVTLAILAARGQWDEFALHIRATANTGATPDDIQEVILHVAIYAGVPAANKAIKVAKATLAELAE